MIRFWTADFPIFRATVSSELSDWIEADGLILIDGLMIDGVSTKKIIIINYNNFN